MQASWPDQIENAARAWCDLRLLHSVHILVVTMLRLLWPHGLHAICKLLVCQFSVLRKLRRGFCTIVLHYSGKTSLMQRPIIPQLLQHLVVRHSYKQNTCIDMASCIL